MLSDAERAHLERVLYPAALAAAGEPDSPRNRTIAANDYWLFLQARRRLGRGGDRGAAARPAVVRAGRPAAGPLGSAPP